MSDDKTQDPNRLFRYRLKKGEAALRILLSKSAAGSASQYASDDAGDDDPYKSRITPRYIPNELIPRKKKGLVNFWDLGQVWTGSEFVDITFRKPIEIVSPTSIASYTWTADDWDTFRDLILESDPDDWETYYKKLTHSEAERYGLDVLKGDPFDPDMVYPVARNESRFSVTNIDSGGGTVVVADTKWTDQGLKIDDPMSQATFWSYGAFQVWRTGFGETKWTTDPSFAADDVGEKAIDPGAKVFLMPLISVSYGAASAIPDNDRMYRPYETQQRSFWFDRNYEDTGYPLMSVPSSFPGISESPLFVADKSTLLELWRGDPDSIGYDLTPGTFRSPAMDFPLYHDAAFLQSQYGRLSVNTIEPNSPSEGTLMEGVLVAMVKQNGHVYYVWGLDTFFWEYIRARADRQIQIDELI